MIPGRLLHYLLPVSITVLALVAANLLRTEINARRSQLDLEPQAGVSGEPGRSSGFVVVTAGSGVFRALAINLFWLRAIELERDGRYFESAALAKAITTLQPRLPDVWVYQASRLASDVSAVSPREDRFGWVMEAVRLLRDRGLPYNPTSSRLHAALAFLFLYKFDSELGDGYVLDDAHRHSNALASVFDLPAGPSREELLERWKLESGRLDSLAADYIEASEGDPVDARRLDLRASGTHCLYWADLGLSLAHEGEERYAVNRLRLYKKVALERLLLKGRVVRRPGGGGGYAFLPDLRFVDVVEGLLERDVEEARGRTAAEREAAAEVRRDFLRAVTVYFFLYNRRGEAERWFERHAAAMTEREESLGEFLVGSLAPESLDAAWGRDPAQVLEKIAAVLRAALYLQLAGERELAAGVTGLGVLLRERWISLSGGRELPAIEECSRALGRELLGRLRGNERMAALAGRLGELLGSSRPEPPAPAVLGLPPAPAWPLGLEALNPLERVEP